MKSSFSTCCLTSEQMHALKRQVNLYTLCFYLLFSVFLISNALLSSPLPPLSLLLLHHTVDPPLLVSFPQFSSWPLLRSGQVGSCLFQWFPVTEAFHLFPHTPVSPLSSPISYLRLSLSLMCFSYLCSLPLSALKALYCLISSPAVMTQPQRILK